MTLNGVMTVDARYLRGSWAFAVVLFQSWNNIACIIQFRHPNNAYTHCSVIAVNILIVNDSKQWRFDDVISKTLLSK